MCNVGGREPGDVFKEVFDQVSLVGRVTGFIDYPDPVSPPALSSGLPGIRRESRPKLQVDPRALDAAAAAAARGGKLEPSPPATELRPAYCSWRRHLHLDLRSIRRQLSVMVHYRCPNISSWVNLGVP